MYTRNSFTFSVIVLFALVIFASVFVADYLYLDEAYELWYPHRVYNIFASQGRLLIAIVYRSLFKYVDTAAEMKYIRIISLAGWILSSFLLFVIVKNWVKQLKLSIYLPYILSVFCICSSSVAIYIGWGGACLQMFPAFIFALLSAHFIFLALTSPTNKIPPSRVVQSITCGIVALLFYQTMFGVFILPCVLIWISAVEQKNKKLVIGIVVYLAIYLLYFLFFKFYLQALHIVASNRTEVDLNPIKKIAFFFSTPFSQAWNLNLLHNLHNIVSQVIPILIFVTWLVLFIKQSKDKRASSISTQIVVILLLFGLSYLPSLIASENFSSYRTMLPFSLCSFSLLMIAVLEALKREKSRRIFLIAFSVFLFGAGWFNFNINYVRPLTKEFNALKVSPEIQKIRTGDTVVFIRPDAKLFKRLYGISGYKDEFGLPSTYRDWSPEEITRQLVKEQQSDPVARSLTVYQFTNEEGFPDSLRIIISSPIVIDVNAIMENKAK